jgi:thiol:disulfide interchange protein
MKKIKWNSLQEFSFKDLISILLIVCFIGTLVYSLISKNPTVVSLVTTQIPIILAILGLYGSSEVISNRFNANSTNNQSTQLNFSSSNNNVEIQAMSSESLQKASEEGSV